MARHAARFAYLLERYPAFTQTFIVREIAEMRRQGLEGLVVSLRAGEKNGEDHFPKSATENVVNVPEADALVAEIKRRRASGELPKKINQRLEAWGKEPDKLRLYEAIWAGDFLQKRAIRHLHVHFAGLAARTACLVKELYGITFSFTGHAQDIFCKTEHAIDLGRLVREASAVVTVADFSADKLRGTYPALRRKIRRVYNGIAVPAVCPEHVATEVPLILSVGRLIPKKGFPDLLRACAQLRDRDVPFRCEIVGDGPQEAELAAQIVALGLEKCVALVGAWPQEKVVQRLRAARVFALAAVVLPDGDSDNLPTVITEGMAQGVPVVSTAVAGIPEQIADGATGFVVPPGDPAAFAEKLEILLKDPPLAAQMGQAAFNRAQTDFSLESCVRQLRSLVAPKPWWKLI